MLVNHKRSLTHPAPVLKAGHPGAPHYIHDLIIHEMLRKKGKATQYNRKTKQHNTTRVHMYVFGVFVFVRNVAGRLFFSFLLSSLGWYAKYMYFHEHTCTCQYCV